MCNKHGAIMCNYGSSGYHRLAAKGTITLHEADSLRQYSKTIIREKKGLKKRVPTSVNDQRKKRKTAFEEIPSTSKNNVIVEPIVSMMEDRHDSKTLSRDTSEGSSSESGDTDEDVDLPQTIVSSKTCNVYSYCASSDSMII